MNALILDFLVCTKTGRDSTQNLTTKIKFRKELSCSYYGSEHQILKYNVYSTMKKI